MRAKTMPTTNAISTCLNCLRRFLVNRLNKEDINLLI